jgi:CubicO group peptidase (beta-lactamase class C family)
MKKVSAAVLGLALVASMTSVAIQPARAQSAPVAGAPSDELRGVLEGVRAQTGLPSLAAGFSIGDSVMEYAATGYRQWGSDVKVRDNDVYHLGSDTKSMTATVIARLAEQGVLSWDQPIEQLAPNVSMNPQLKGVTLGMIFSHHSGISGVQFPPGFPTIRNDGNALSIEEKRPWFTFILNQPLTSTPGTKYEYSNNAISAGAFIVEVKTGKTIEQLLKEQLFDPLGMSSCTVGYLQPAALEMPMPHIWGPAAPTPMPNAGNPRQFDASGQARCSMRDFLVYVRAHVMGETKGGILKPESWKNLHTVRYTDGLPYALGTVQYSTALPWANGTYFTHSGSNVRNYATLYFAPGTQTAIVIATNIGGDAQGNLARVAKAEQDAAAAMLPLIAARSAALKAAAAPAPTQPPASTPAVTAAPTPSTPAPASAAKPKCKGKGKKRVCR